MQYLYILLAALAVIAIWYISTANSLKRQRVKVEEGLSGIDVALTKRYDSLTKIMEVAKAFAKHESEVLSQVIQLRSGMTMAERERAAGEVEAMGDRIRVLAEAYPELKSSENYRQLQVAAMDAEEHLLAARRLYNSNVSALNRSIVSFPTSIVAGNIGMSQMEFFRAEDKKREDVKIDL